MTLLTKQTASDSLLGAFHKTLQVAQHTAPPKENYPAVSADLASNSFSGSFEFVLSEAELM